MTLIITVLKKHICNVTFINVISKVLIIIDVVSKWLAETNALAYDAS